MPACLSKRNSRRWLAVLMAAVSVLLVLAIHFTSRLSQHESGLCVAANEMFGEEELASRIATHLLLIEIGNSRSHEAFFRNGRLRVGLIRNLNTSDIRALVEAAFRNERSFEENFSIQRLPPAAPAPDVLSFERPFTIVTYDALSGGGATFIATANIRRAPSAAASGSEKAAGLFERYRGFGNHYYRVTRTFIARDCCDNQTFGSSREDYLERKKQAYESSMQSFDRGLAIRDDLIAVSNCGDILTTDSDIGAGLRTIKWIAGKARHDDNAE